MARRPDVQDTYDAIASHFAKTRPAPWPAVEEFLADRTGRTGLDIGTGNGRHAETLAPRVNRVVALDISHASLTTALARANSKHFTIDPVLAEAASLPIRTSTIDLAVYIATLHHLPTKALRRTSLNELARVLTPTGTALVSAWSTRHKSFEQSSSFDTTIDWTLPDGTRIGRYYHIYDPAEFSADLTASILTVQDTFIERGNCYAIVTAKE